MRICNCNDLPFSFGVDGRSTACHILITQYVVYSQATTATDTLLLGFDGGLKSSIATKREREENETQEATNTTTKLSRPLGVVSSALTTVASARGSIVFRLYGHHHDHHVGYFRRVALFRRGLAAAILGRGDDEATTPSARCNRSVD